MSDKGEPLVCVICPDNTKICGPGVGPGDCAGGPIAEIGKCPADWCWEIKIDVLGCMSSMWKHKHRPRVYAFTQYEKWHEDCVCA